MPHSIEQVKAMLTKAGVTDTFGTKKEIKQLPSILDEDETIIYATSGILDKVGIAVLYGVNDNNGGTVLAVVTNKRLIFIDKGLLYGIKVADIPLRVLNSVIYAKGLIFGSITVSHGSRSFTIKNVNKNTANIFASKTKEQLGDLNKSQSPGYKVDKAVAKSAVEQVRGLKELLDIDAITKEEFEKKKKELLGL